MSFDLFGNPDPTPTQGGSLADAVNPQAPLAVRMRPRLIDEIVGQLIVLTAAPHHPVAVLAGFALFRLFDILKPFPVGWIDRHLHGGLGIMLDDVAAALYALLVLQLGLWLFARL